MQIAILQTDFSKEIQSDNKNLKSFEDEKANLFNSLLEEILKSNPKQISPFISEKISKDSKLIKSDLKNKPSKEPLEINNLPQELSLIDLFNILNKLEINSKKDLKPNIAKNTLPLNIDLKDFKNAKSLKELIQVAQKHGIKIKSLKIDKHFQKNFSKDLSTEIRSIFEKIINEKSQIFNSTSIKTQEILHNKTKIKKISNNTKNLNIPKNEIHSSKTKEKDTLSSLLSQKLEKKSSPKKLENIHIDKKYNKKSITEHKKSVKEPIEEIENFSSQALKEDKEIEINSNETKEKETINLHSQKEVIKTNNEYKTQNPNQNQKSMNHFAQKFKEIVENYKPPITKLQVSLNPKNLGEVEVTLIHRGENLHVSINPQNIQAFNLFNQNQTEFKNALLNIGFSSIDMSFSNQNQQKDQNQNQKFYKKQSKDEKESLEIPTQINFIIPKYI